MTHNDIALFRAKGNALTRTQGSASLHPVLWVLFILLVSPLLGCKTTTEYVTVYQKCDCALPLILNGFYRRPGVGEVGQHISLDGKKLAFYTNSGSDYFFILDLQTLELKVILLKNILPDTASWLRSTICNAVRWCPYSSSKIYLACLETRVKVGYNNGVGYIYDLNTNAVTRVNPSKYGKFGLEGGNDFRGWLKGSKEGVDSILLDTAIYLVQQDSMYPRPLGYRRSITQSLHTDDIISTDGFSPINDELDIYLNSVYFHESHSIALGGGMSFSPNGRKIALTVTPRIPPSNQEQTDYTGFQEIWIIDRDNPKTGDEFASYKLNFQDLFCTYSGWGIHAEYITDSTLAVSMHKDGDAVSPLWEITDKGRIVRQLTK